LAGNMEVGVYQSKWVFNVLISSQIFFKWLHKTNCWNKTSN